jgi:hypothetical protein
LLALVSSPGLSRISLPRSFGPEGIRNWHPNEANRLQAVPGKVVGLRHVRISRDLNHPSAAEEILVLLGSSEAGMEHFTPLPKQELDWVYQPPDVRPGAISR